MDNCMEHALESLHGAKNDYSPPRKTRAVGDDGGDDNNLVHPLTLTPLLFRNQQEQQKKRKEAWDNMSMVRRRRF